MRKNYLSKTDTHTVQGSVIRIFIALLLPGTVQYVWARKIYAWNLLVSAIAFCSFISLPVAAQPSKAPSLPIASKSPAGKHQLTYKIIKGEQNTFGYDILDYNRPMIQQPTIPAMPGNKGFARKEDAEKVAKLVIEKINKNIMPPSVTRQELTTLKIKL